MAKRLQCAVYTRKSTEEGLDQEFNSLAAQREACQAFIRSQRHEGWHLVTKAYDDGGISGATMNRPALRRLLADLQHGKIDVVVVYKVDRLTRSLSDFARMVEIFDTHRASFVSITQQFNTTSSMGRLTLNVLLSFAQFEREVTAERIRDKISASKRKGMWMGGVVPLGYDAIDKRLVVNAEEAKTVRTIFELYRDHGNVERVRSEVDRMGLRTKPRRTNTGSRSGGEPFTRGHLYKLLSNPVYIGQTVHKGERYAAIHEAIVDRGTWDSVQGQLASNAVRRRSATNAVTPSLLTGLVYDQSGVRMGPSYTSKGQRRYRYYCSRLARKGHTQPAVRLRVPAEEIERVTLDAICSLLTDRRRLTDALQSLQLTARQLRAAIGGASDLAKQLNASAEPGRRTMLRQLVERLEVGDEKIRIRVRTDPLMVMLGDRIVHLEEIRDNGATEEVVAFEIPWRDDQRDRNTALVLEATARTNSRRDTKLIWSVARGYSSFHQLRGGGVGSVAELARRSGVDRAELSRSIRLAFLAPDIVEKILSGRQPAQLTASQLVRLTRLPLSWAEQRELLGFR